MNRSDNGIWDTLGHILAFFHISELAASLVKDNWKNVFMCPNASHAGNL
jgi:hypothetical protein